MLSRTLPALGLALLLLTGCRPPAPPAPGWAVVAALTTLHPQSPRVADLDHQLTILLAQRTHLLARPAHAVPPGEVRVAAPALPALSAPPGNSPPAQPYQALDAQDLAALRSALAHEQAREYARAEQAQKARAVRALADTRLQLVRVAETQQIAIAKTYRTPIVNAQLKVQTITEQKTRFPNNNYGYALAHPKDVTADTLDRDLKAAQDALAQVKNEFAAKLAEVDARMQRDLLAAQARQAEADGQILDALRQTQSEQLDQTLAQEQQRLAAEALTRTPATTAPDVTFPTVPPAASVLAHPALLQAVQAARDADARRRTAAVATLDLAAADVLTQRRALTAQIARETEAAAVRVAEQHGYVLSCARPTGVNLTHDLRDWLKTYWPERKR